MPGFAFDDHMLDEELWLSTVIDTTGREMNTGLLKSCIKDLFKNGYFESFQYRQWMDAVIIIEHHGAMPGSVLFWNVNEQTWASWTECINDMFTLYEMSNADLVSQWERTRISASRAGVSLGWTLNHIGFPHGLHRFRLNPCNATRPEYRCRGVESIGMLVYGNQTRNRVTSTELDNVLARGEGHPLVIDLSSDFDGEISTLLDWGQDDVGLE